MPTNSKQKGSTFERKIAKRLSEQFASFIGADQGFIRNRGSGSYFGGKNFHRAKGVVDEHLDVGDIITPMSFRWNLELKHYATPITFKAVMANRSAQWDKWIAQATQDTVTSKKEDFILVIKYNLVPEIVILGLSFNNNLLFNNIGLVDYKGHIVTTLDVFLSKDSMCYFNNTIKGNQK